MSEPRPRQRGRSRDASATQASRKHADAPVGRSTPSRDASRRSARAGKGAAAAEPSPVRRARSRDASATNPSTTQVTAGRRGTDPSRGPGGASRRPAQAAPAGLTPAATSRTTRSRDASVVAASGRARTRPPTGFTCPPCGRFVPTEVDGMVLGARRGSPPRFCSSGCRQAAYRRRQAGVSEDTALQLRGGRDRSLGERQGAGDD